MQIETEWEKDKTSHLIHMITYTSIDVKLYMHIYIYIFIYIIR